MKLLSLFLMFSGYTLIYAGIANQGTFATNPWMGLFADAYPVDSSTSSGGGIGGWGPVIPGSGSAPNSSPGVPRARVAPPSPVAPAGGGGGGSVLQGILKTLSTNLNPLGPLGNLFGIG